MKKFLSLSISTALLILLFFTVQVLSQKINDKTKAFKSSITFESEGDYKKALDEILPFYNANKSSYIFNIRLGWLYYQNGKYDSSKVYYSNALTINKNSIEAMLGLAYPLSALQEWNALQKLYVDILKADPNNYTANLRLGQIHLNKMEYQSALKYLEKVHSQYQSNYEPNLSLGWTYYYLGNYTKAKELFTTASMLSPTDSLAALGLKYLK